MVQSHSLAKQGVSSERVGMVLGQSNRRFSSSFARPASESSGQKAGEETRYIHAREALKCVNNAAS